MTTAYPMRLVSVLSPHPAASGTSPPPSEDAPYFPDLAIDRILDAVLKSYEPYELRVFFQQVPHQQDVIEYRHAILTDLATEKLGNAVRAFRDNMRNVRQNLDLAQKSFNQYQAAFYALLAIRDYCESVRQLDASFGAARPHATGLVALHQALHAYVAAPEFVNLAAQAQHHHDALASICYTVLLNDSTLTVRGFEDEPDYNAVIQKLFARFQPSVPPKSTPKSRETGVWIGNVQSQILDGVAQINQDIFTALCSFTAHDNDFIDPVLSRFEREAQFYLAWIDFTARLSASGLRFSLPTLVNTHEIHATDAFDLALAAKLCDTGKSLVTNDFYLEKAERIFVISGPNQGGKTTFARTFGQMHYFANLGLSVPGENVQLQFFDRIFTHFEREEALTALHGKLYDDLVRVHAILESATADSLIILNEIFNSTALKDALFLADKVLRKVIEIGALGVCVTFMDELASLGPQTVSMTSMVDPDNPAKRSFHVVRRQADGLAYALSIAKKYGVTYQQLKERLT